MTVTLPPEAKAALDRLIAQHGSAEEAAAVLYDDNYRHRQRAQQLKTDAEDAQEDAKRWRAKAEAKGNGAKDGELVLTVDEAKTWKEFQDLKLKPADLKKQLEDGEKSTRELAEVRETEREAGVAAAAGYKPSVLRMVTKDKGLHVELREVPVTTDGKTEKKKVPYVRKVSDDKSAGEPLTDYVERDLKDLLPSLKVATTDEEEGLGDTVQIPEQRPASGKPSKADPVKSYLDKKYGTPETKKT